MGGCIDEGKGVCLDAN
jgi:small subunit ribosomal protein S35